MTFATNDLVEQAVVASYTAQDIRNAIHDLPEHHRTVVVLRYLQDFSYTEIADSLGLPLNTVKSYLFRARQQLQTSLSHYQKGGVHE
jgi:RNA polymerase sigma-70 factor (ECF subfamily)